MNSETNHQRQKGAPHGAPDSIQGNAPGLRGDSPNGRRSETERSADRATLAYAIDQSIFCTSEACGKILDISTAVYLQSGPATALLCGACADNRRDSIQQGLASGRLTVIDGAEVSK